MWDIIFEHYIIFLIVFTRVTGMIIFNPFLSRKSVPVIIKIGLSFVLAFLFTGFIPQTNIVIKSMIDFVLVCMKELFIGFITGMVIQMFLSVLLLAGEFIDLQLGIGMAKIYDPHSNISMPVSASIFNLVYTVIFFVSNGHLTFIKIIYFSFDIFPLGAVIISPNCGTYVVMLFSNILVLALKLALPIMAIEIVTEIGLGVIMRAVPQINVFAVGLQLKLLVGIALLVLVFPQIFAYLDNLSVLMLKGVFDVLKHSTT